MKAIASSRESGLSSSGDSGGKEFSSSLRASSRAALATWLSSLSGRFSRSRSLKAEVARLQVLGVAFQAPAQRPLVPELLVERRPSLQEFEYQCLVKHGGSFGVRSRACLRPRSITGVG